jgi:8-oxo-dGTP pyrophosphatase MutT (NUDIX family)
MMISFDVGESMKFNYRSAGLVVLDGRILFQRFSGRDWWFLPGGRVEMQEDSIAAVARELAEEYGWRIKDRKLKLVVENFFRLDGRDFHEIGMYYLIGLEDRVRPVDGEFAGKEENLVSKWIGIGELARHKIVPPFLKDAALFEEILSSDTVKHLICR